MTVEIHKIKTTIKIIRSRTRHKHLSLRAFEKLESDEADASNLSFWGNNCGFLQAQNQLITILWLRARDDIEIKCICNKSLDLIHSVRRFRIVARSNFWYFSMFSTILPSKWCRCRQMWGRLKLHSQFVRCSHQVVFVWLHAEEHNVTRGRAINNVISFYCQKPNFTFSALIVFIRTEYSRNIRLI